MTFKTDYSNLNGLWSALLIEELSRLGVQHFCIAPGSRSAPLTLALAERQDITRHVHFDERGLAFFALGLVKASGQPVAVVTTSGTAVANLYPAMIEARQSGVPLIMMTADRPPELIDCGANQAIEQHGIYANYPGASLDLPAPDQAIPANWVLSSIDQAFARSCQQRLPLHINCPFREPLYPDGQQVDYCEYLQGVSRWLDSEKVYTAYQLPELGSQPTLDSWQVFIEGKGLIIAGRIDSQADAEAVAQLARTLGWPLIADIQSQLHGHPDTVKTIDLLLASESGQALIQQADRVLLVGGYLVSKRLDQFLGVHSWQHYIMLGQEARRIDTANQQTCRIVGSISEFCYRLAEISGDSFSWGSELYPRADALQQQLIKTIETDGLTERWLCANLAQQLPDNALLFVGNSLPIRMVDMFSISKLPTVFANRGASGIDGLLATAAGCCAARQQPTVLLVGDVSFLHDLNSLQLLKQVQAPMVIILINNDGGGIFNLLPMEHAADQRSEYFVTPHGLNARYGAAMFDVDYAAPRSQQAFIEVLQRASSISAGTIIEAKACPGQGAESIRDLVKQVQAL